MDITAVDRSAVLGDTLLHRAAPTSKLVGAGLLLGAIVTVNDPLVAAGLALSLAGAAAAVGLPLRQMLPLALYPALFAIVFAFAAAPGPATGALFVLKAVTAALTVVTLMFSTPYPQVFAPIQRITPTIVGDALLMTYRSLFILAEKFSDLLRAVRLRSGVSARQPVRAARATARALGGLLLYSLDLSQREYDILRLRGYEGGMRVRRQVSTDRSADVAALLYAALILAVVVVFRALPHELGGYAWLVTVVGAVDLTTGLLIGRRT
ncbi:MAG: energy-coupling factor transporter transmembrane component T [Coriobacteriia bacterium]|nr:energy-coupling factor transporter transmembrane component T [Coriobacteriia bacterium]